MGMLREYMPELVTLNPPEGTRVHVIVPAKDSSGPAALEIAQALLGASHEALHFKGPAYKHLPVSPCALMHLHERETPVDLKNSTVELPRKCGEAFAGSAILTQKLALVGFETRAFEVLPALGGGGPDKEIEESDLERPEVLEALASDIRAHLYYCLLYTSPSPRD